MFSGMSICRRLHCSAGRPAVPRPHFDRSGNATYCSHGYFLNSRTTRLNPESTYSTSDGISVSLIQENYAARSVSKANPKAVIILFRRNYPIGTTLWNSATPHPKKDPPYSA